MKLSFHTLSRRCATLIYLVLATQCIATLVAAQSLTSAGDVEPPPTLAELQTMREAAEKDSKLSAEDLSQAMSFYDRAVEALDQTKETTEGTAALISRIESAPARVAELRERLESARTPVEATPRDPDAPAEQLNAALNEQRAALTVARDALDEKETALSSLTKSGAAIVKEYVVRERSLAKISEELRAPVSAGVSAVVEQSRKIYLSARRALERAQLDQLHRRNASYEQLVELTTLERDLVANKAARTQEEYDRLEMSLQKRRESDARAARWEAEATIIETAQLPSPVSAIAEKTAALKKELVTVVERNKDVSDALRIVTRRYRELRDRFQIVRERINLYGASQALGRLLQRRLEKLPSPREQKGFLQARRSEIANATDRRIEVEDRQQQLVDIEAQVESIMSSIESMTEAPEREALLVKITALVRAHDETLADLDRVYARYLTKLTALEAAEREVANISREFSDFIRKELTWIPNLSPISVSDFAALPKALGWLFAPANWRQALSDVGRTLLNNPLYSIVAFFAIMLGVIVRWRARHLLPELADLTRRVRTDAYSHTAKAFALTIVGAGTWPLIFAVVGWQVEAQPIGAPFGNAVGSALIDLVPFVFVLSLTNWLTRSDGLALRHFRWPAAVSAALHKRIGWLAAFLLPAAFLIYLAAHAGVVELSYAIGRPMLLIGLLTMVVFVWRLFRRTGSLMRYFDEKSPDNWISRLWILWFPVTLGAPVFLFLAAAFGYAHTAGELTRLLVGETAGLLLALILIRDMLLRWFYIVERRSRFDTALRQREEARDHREDDTGSASFEIDIPEVDYRGLGEQARAVIRVGVLLGLVLSVGWIWGDLLPAIGFLDRIELPFSKVEMVDGVEQQLPVSLADFAIGLLILLGALFAAKNLSGLLEFTILRRLRFDAGGNYAIVTLCQYTIVAVGILAAFSSIGLQWSKLQWLIAALGVGLGFGLQEIVANFVSGIILLLERPVRIGDIVTVGQADGYVSRIQIRATTILTWEKKELIIPNKEFITGQVVNWTLSDSVNRILINVGIAYGSDVRKALDILESVAKESPQVLEDPMPIITFEAFGDNALMLYVRCYISSLDERLATVTALHEAIYRKFEEAGIVIAFPQRDVHLATSAPLDIRVHQATE